jgi:hypothetical protein
MDRSLDDFHAGNSRLQPTARLRLAPDETQGRYPDIAREQ